MWLTLVSNALPIIILIGLFVFMMRQLQSGGGKAMNFGKSKAKLLNESGRRVTFEDVSGVQEAKEELEEIIQFLKD
ncbi:cell division protein FtsH, partial [Myxococcota bacterium]|nr:cell division protein FtsH [Myxococcota bacterium]